MTEQHTPLQESKNTVPPVSQPRKSFMERNHLFVKICFMGFLILLLLIPINMIMNLIEEREETATGAVSEVQSKWSGSQTIIGPMLSIPYYNTVIENDKPKRVMSNMQILPELLEVNGVIHTEILKRGMYEVIVYNSPITMKGSFLLPENFGNVNKEDLMLNAATLNIGLSDLRGLGEQVKLNWGGEELIFESGVEDCKLVNSGVSLKIDMESFQKGEGNRVDFAITMKLKGSQSLMFAPIGKTTLVNIESNCVTPSFAGAFLPNERSVHEAGFKSSWQVLDLNRNYPQVLAHGGWSEAIDKSLFGVNLLLPVHQYQLSMRSLKYAFLIIVLTFVVSFFVEIIQKKNINPLQYLLVGLGLTLFYSLLISMSEHFGFNLAYLISATMTVLLLTVYMIAVLNAKRMGLTIGGLLAALYAYIYVLLQLETYSLLVGSIGLFVILAVIMYYSQKINLGKGSKEH